MSWLYSDKAPFLLTLLLGMLTWQAGELFDGLRSGKAIIYELGEDPPPEVAVFDHMIALRMENPSRNQVAGPFSFTINCKVKLCLTGRSRAIVEEPTFANVATDHGKSEDRAKISATLAPGAVAWLVAEARPTIKGQSPQVIAIFDANLVSDPDGKSEMALRVIEGSSIEAQIVGGWLHFLYWGIILVMFAIVVWLILAVIHWRNAVFGKSQQASPMLSGKFELSDETTQANLSALSKSIDNRMGIIVSKLESLSKGDDNVPAASRR